MATQQIHARSLGEIINHGNLEARGITVKHANQTILSNVSLAVRPGQLTALVGPSGAGKTTLLKALALIERPQSGALTINDRQYTFPMPASQKFVEPWPQVTAVFQQLFLWPHLTLRKNITLALGKAPSDSQLEYLEHLIARFQMASFIDRFPNQASVGQRQRAALVRALVLKPQYLLLDEITSSLDVEQIALILSEIKSLKENGIGILLITHLLQFARHAADSIIFLEQGKVIESGGTEVLIRPMNRRVQEFLELAEFAS